jgi:hypothetical protein
LRRAGHPDGGVAGAAQQAQRRQTRQARTRHRQACRVALRRRFDASDAPGRAAVCHRPSRPPRRAPHGPLFGAPAAFEAACRRQPARARNSRHGAPSPLPPPRDATDAAGLAPRAGSRR